MKKITALFSSIGYLASTTVAAAATPFPSQTINLQPPPGINPYMNLNQLFANAVTLVFIVAAVLVFIMLLWGGIEWIMSGGDKEKVGNARKRIVNALVGLAILALAFLILNVVGQLIGFPILGQPFTLPTPSTNLTPTPVRTP